MSRSFMGARLVAIFLFYGVVNSFENLPTNGSTSTGEVSQLDAPDICDEGGRGLLFPLYDGEHRWNMYLRALCYALGLIYCFMGVSIIADIFMSSIEEITSRRRQIDNGKGKTITAYCWNDTVANLSLMALGSSAPEIFLSIIDVVRKEMYAGDLGPSTIVGSAAFNLLVIVAVCVVCIPYPESREIEQMEVFILTAIFSVVAYFWMAFILVVQSPNEVELWEALVTLFFLPVLIWMAYRVDVMGWAGLGLDKLPCCRESGSSDSGEADGVSEERPSQHENRPSRQASMDTYAGTSSCDSQAYMSEMSSEGKVKPKSPISQGSTPRGARRITVRQKTIAAHHMVAMSKIRQSTLSFVSTQRSMSTSSTNSIGSSTKPSHRTSLDFWSCNRESSIKSSTPYPNGVETTHPIVQLLVDRQVMQQDINQKVLTLCCRGELERPLRIQYKVELLAEPHMLPPPYRSAYDVDEKRPERSRPQIAELLGYGNVDVPLGTITKDFLVDIPKPVEGACKDFIVSLRASESLATADIGPDIVQTLFKLGPIDATQIDVKPFKDPGFLGFATSSIVVSGRSDDFTLHIVVLRRGGCNGVVSCTYCTEPFDAVPDYDYQDIHGCLTFGEGVTEQLIEVQINGKSNYRGAYKFLVVLSALMDSCGFDPAGDGGEDSAILTIQVLGREEGRNTTGRMLDYVLNIGKCKVATNEWVDQIKSVRYCNGSAEEQQEATVTDWIFHILLFPWKIIFLAVPPPRYGGGWVCFYMSLAFIAALTGIIADFAELFGCILKIGDMVTAITFVALGTSMPDLFASKVAAIEDPTADASIVNVTGSNAVNVFLGLGLPWTMAAIYWGLRDDLRPEWAVEYPDMADIHKIGCVFVVRAENLGFCVTVFSCFALLSLTVLIFRRRKLDCELGGPVVPKYLTAISFFGMWIGYVVLASWRYARWDIATHSEVILVLAIMFSLQIMMASVVVASFYTVDMGKYNDEKIPYEEAKENQARKDAEEGLKKLERKSTNFLSELAADETTHSPLQGENDFADGDRKDDNHFTGTMSVHSFTAVDSEKQLNGISGTTGGQSEHHVNSKSEEGRNAMENQTLYVSDSESNPSAAISSSMAQIIAQQVPAESKAMLPRGLLDSSLLRNGLEPTAAANDDGDASGGPSNHQPHFGPKLVPK